MYCDYCHHEHQPINDKISRKFSAFIKTNRKWVDQIKDGVIIRLPEDMDSARNSVKLFPNRKTKYHIYNLDMLEEPYNVRYIGVRSYGEGSMIEFMDDNMDKVFSFYDVM